MGNHNFMCHPSTRPRGVEDAAPYGPTQTTTNVQTVNHITTIYCSNLNTVTLTGGSSIASR